MCGVFCFGIPAISILDSELAATLTDALTQFDIPQSCVVTVQTQSGPPYAPVITNVDYACSGWVDTYSNLDHANGDVLITDRKVFIVKSTLAVTPSPDNTVTIGGATYSIITVQLDPAGAAWVMQVRT